MTHGFGTLAALKYIELADMPVVEGLFSIAGFKDDAQAISEDLNTQDFTLLKVKYVSSMVYVQKTINKSRIKKLSVLLKR